MSVTVGITERREQAEMRAIEAMAKVFYRHLTGSEYSTDVWTKASEKRAWVAANEAFEAMWEALRAGDGQGGDRDDDR